MNRFVVEASVLVVAALGAGCGQGRAKPPQSSAGASTPTPAKASASGAEPAETHSRVRVGETNHSGRLPPPVIQKVVRDAYDWFRRCYEAALVRDPDLEGKVVVRFVIDRQGKVDGVTLEPGTTLADKAAVECMLTEYRALSFPPPEGGIVTVVYPIMFSPG